MIDSYNRLKHLALSIEWDDGSQDKINILIPQLMRMQVENDIPILSIECKMPDLKFEEFLRFYVKKKFLDENNIKINFIGKWYDQSDSIVKVIKDLVKSTSSYSNYFFNFIVNYDGQEEIVDACRILCRQVIANKLDIDQINKMKLKDNMYTSYFVPPEKILIVSANERKSKGFLLWDSYHSETDVVNSYDFEEIKKKI